MSYCHKLICLKGYSTFFGNRLNSPRVKQSSFTVFESIQAIFLIFRRISVTRQFLASLASIVHIFPTMEVNETRNCLVTDILLNI